MGTFIREVFPPIFCYIILFMMIVSFLTSYLMVRFNKDLNYWYRSKDKFPTKVFLKAAFAPALQIVPLMIGLRIGAVLA